MGFSHLGSPHLYRIEWYPNHVVYYVDGIQVADHAIGIAGGMRPIASDGPDAASLSVDWMRMTPFSGPCTFTSRVHDVGQPVDWLDLYHFGSTPIGTSTSFETRSGFTPVPGAGWSPWQAVTGTTIVSPHSRYLQYRFTLTSADPHRTPVVDSVVLTYAVLPPLTISGNTGQSGVTLSYEDGSPTFVISDGTGFYSFQVLYGWSGVVTPSKPGYGFLPANRSYTNLDADRTAQDYEAGLCYTLSLSVLPSSGGSVTPVPAPNCSGGRYFTGTVVMLTATAGTGYGFSSWSGDAGSPSNQTAVTMNSDRAVTAVFSPLGPFASWAGSVSISSNRPVVAVARPHVGEEVASYDGVSSGSLTAYVPMLFKGSFGGSYNAALYVQNIDPTHTANITVKFYDNAGTLSCTETPRSRLWASKGYWVPDLTCLPAGWVGGAVITSDFNIVAVGRPHVGPEVMTYNGFSSGSLTSYLPMLFKNAWGSYDSAFYVQNVDTADTANITIKFYDSAGTLSCTLTDTVAPLASKGWWVPNQSCLPVGWVGGAVVTSDQPIVTIGRPHVGSQVTSYSGFPAGSPSMYVPMLFKNAFGGML